MPRDLAVALEGVHVAEVHAAARDPDRADQDGPRPHRVDVHVAVRAQRELLGREGPGVGRPEQEGAEVAGVVGVGQVDARHRPELAHERPQAGHHADEVVGGEEQDRVLDRRLGQRGRVGGVVGEQLGLLPVDRHAQPARLVEGDGVAVGERERGGGGPAVGAADAVRADALHDRRLVGRPAPGQTLAQ